VGSEGTLGVITAATLRLQPRPAGDTVTFRAAFDSLASAGAGVMAVMASRVVPEVMELLDRASVEAVERLSPTGIDISGLEALIVGQLIGPTAHADAEHLARLLRGEGALSVDCAEGDALLEARRATGPALSAAGLRVSSDIGVPVSRLADIFTAIEHIGHEEGVRIPTFAHAGDGNLHPSVIVSGDSEDELKNAERILNRIMDAALALGGTASGEHGVGSLKLGALARQLDHGARTVQALIKSALDPNCILSPGRAI
jgi:glycolate oxidase